MIQNNAHVGYDVAAPYQLPNPIDLIKGTVPQDTYRKAATIPVSSSQIGDIVQNYSGKPAEASGSYFVVDGSGPMPMETPGGLKNYDGTPLASYKGDTGPIQTGCIKLGNCP